MYSLKKNYGFEHNDLSQSTNISLDKTKHSTLSIHSSIFFFYKKCGDLVFTFRLFIVHKQYYLCSRIISQT